MKDLKRQTNFSLKELLDLLGSHGDSYPRCMLINEVGTICCKGEDPDGSGENYLVSLLSDKDKNHRAIAASYLFCLENTTGRHANALAEFRAKPENITLLSSIDKAVVCQMTA